MGEGGREKDGNLGEDGDLRGGEGDLGVVEREIWERWGFGWWRL